MYRLSKFQMSQPVLKLYSYSFFSVPKLCWFSVVRRSNVPICLLSKIISSNSYLHKSFKTSNYSIKRIDFKPSNRIMTKLTVLLMFGNTFLYLEKLDI